MAVAFHNCRKLSAHSTPIQVLKCVSNVHVKLSVALYNLRHLMVKLSSETAMVMYDTINGRLLLSCFNFFLNLYVVIISLMCPNYLIVISY